MPKIMSSFARRFDKRPTYYGGSKGSGNAHSSRLYASSRSCITNVSKGQRLRRSLPIGWGSFDGSWARKKPRCNSHRLPCLPQLQLRTSHQRLGLVAGAYGLEKNGWGRLQKTWLSQQKNGSSRGSSGTSVASSRSSRGGSPYRA